MVFDVCWLLDVAIVGCVVCCALCVVCCLLCVVLRLLFDVCCVLLAACWSLYEFGWLRADCILLFVVCRLLVGV